MVWNYQNADCSFKKIYCVIYYNFRHSLVPYKHWCWWQLCRVSSSFGSHGCQCSAMLHLLVYVVKRQLTICFKSSKPLQIGLCTLMSLSIHLHGLHLDTRYGQKWHLLTQLCCRERTGCRLLWSTTLLLPTLLFDSQVLISLVIHGLWWTVSGQVKSHVVQTWTNGVSPNHLLVTVASDATDHEPHCRHVSISKIWRWTESTPRSGWWRSHIAGIYSDCSTREIINHSAPLCLFIEFVAECKQSLSG